MWFEKCRACFKKAQRPFSFGKGDIFKTFPLFLKWIIICLILTDLNRTTTVLTLTRQRTTSLNIRFKRFFTLSTLIYYACTIYFIFRVPLFYFLLLIWSNFLNHTWLDNIDYRTSNLSLWNVLRQLVEFLEHRSVF